MCMSGTESQVEGVQGGVVQGEELRTRQTGEHIKEAEGEDSTYSRILKAGLVTRWKVKMLGILKCRKSLNAENVTNNGAFCKTLRL